MRHTTDPSPATTRRPVDAEAVALLRQAQAGDRDAFGRLYTNHVTHVRHYVAARMRDRDRDAVPDLVQDTFTAALEELHRAPQDVRGWFIQLAAKMCTRHGWRQRSYLRAVLTLGEHQRSQAATAPPEPTRQRIAQALASLDPQQRRTVQLRFLDGHPQQTTAQIMACTRWAVRRRQQQALAHLAAQLTTQPLRPAHAAHPADRPHINDMEATMRARKTTTRCTAQRVEFLTLIVHTAAEGGLGPWARVLGYPTVAPAPADTAAAETSLHVDAVDGATYVITLNDVDRALDAISTGGVQGWDDRSDARMLVRDAHTTDDATDIDAELADAIVQVAVFGEPVYAFPRPAPGWSPSWLA